MKVAFRSVLWSLCGIAAVACLAPQAVSDPSVLHFGRASELRQASVELHSGTLLATVRWTFDNDLTADVLRGRVEFRPNARQCAACLHIRFIQIARTQRNGGAEYTWTGFEENRNQIRTPDGFFVDHRASACTNGEHCSPYFRDSWANPRESADGFLRGKSVGAASLVDYPFGWDVMQHISLESCARCVETGEYLGCAKWGAEWKPVSPRRITAIQVEEKPSATFLNALEKFETFYN